MHPRQTRLSRSWDSNQHPVLLRSVPFLCACPECTLQKQQQQRVTLACKARASFFALMHSGMPDFKLPGTSSRICCHDWSVFHIARCTSARLCKESHRWVLSVLHQICPERSLVGWFWQFANRIVTLMS